MARMSKSRTALTVTCLTLLLGLLALGLSARVDEVPPAAALGLPPLPVKTPTLPVKTPTVPVKTPTLPVKTPTVPVKTPTLPVETPTLPVKTPTVPVKTPTVPVKTPTVAVKTPTVPVKTPTVPAKAPPVPVKPPSTPSLGKAPGLAGGATTTSTRPTTGQPAGGSASAPSQRDATTANGASSAPPSGPAAPAGGSSGYGAGPVVGSLAGKTGTRQSSAERSRTADYRSLAQAVARLQGCLSELPQGARRALMLRTGVGSSRALSPSATAVRLHLGVARLARVERQALGELRRAARTRGCGQMSEIVAAVVAFVGSRAGSGGSGAPGGIETARYAFFAPSRHGIRPPGSSSRSLLGEISPMASDAIVALLLVVGAAIAAGIVVTRGSGHSPPWRRWRRRVADGIRWPR